MASSPGLEVALLVEHAVVRQHRLAVDRVHGAVGEHGERVVDVLGALGEADQRDDPLGRGRDVGERLLGGLQEVLLEQQVLGRVAGERELGEQHQLGAGVARAGDVLAHQARVALEVADARVDLRERERQRGEQSGHAADSVKRAGARAAGGAASAAPATPAAAASSAIAAVERGGEVVEVRQRVVVAQSGRSRSGRRRT